IRYYMTNMDSNNAEFYHRGIRNHWKIENSLHWVKDVFHNEDKNRIKNRNGAINIAIISTIAINLQRLNIGWSIKDAIGYCTFNLKKVIKLFRT
ncbi:transposase, partial [Aureivirga sp. CE67]|uniref:transposase n=1 Tax=Aureivirga sp. CE67 TaxID=1788983 RepID=UPI0018CAE82E